MTSPDGNVRVSTAPDDSAVAGAADGAAEEAGEKVLGGVGCLRRRRLKALRGPCRMWRGQLSRDGSF